VGIFSGAFTGELDGKVAEVPVDQHGHLLPRVITGLVYSHQEPVRVPPHEVESTAVEPELCASTARCERVVQVDRIRLGGLRWWRDRTRNLSARQMKAGHLRAEPSHLRGREHPRKPILDFDLLVEHDPHFAVVPDVWRAILRQRRGKKACEPAAV
jgi:hypothetical protein